MRIVAKSIMNSAWIISALLVEPAIGQAIAADRAGNAPAAFHTRFHIQAHRGAGIDAPENTLEAFLMSWALGVVPEADLRTTKDNVIVCFHDPDLTRVVSNIEPDAKTMSVEQLGVAQVKELEVGSFRGKRFAGQRVPLLADVFAALRGRPQRLLYLDIKTVDLDELAALIREYGVQKQVIFTSEKYPLIRSWKKELPASATLLWNRGSEEQLTAKLQSLRDANFADITYLQIHVHVDDLTSDDPFKPSSSFLRDVGRELKSRGIVFQVLPWKCADPRAYAKLLELGVASFATDYPETTVRVVRQFLTENGPK